MPPIHSDMDHKKSIPYRPCVGIFLLNRHNQVFIAKRIIRNPDPNQDHTPDHILTTGDPWQMPQGGVHDGERPIRAAGRELFEETSIRSWRLLAKSKRRRRYDFPKNIQPMLWQGRYRGQEQIWFAFRFTGTDAEICLDRGDGACHAEFSAWKWASPTVLPTIAVDFKRALYQDVLDEFLPLIDKDRAHKDPAP